jgi:hypothetical protein
MDFTSLSIICSCLGGRISVVDGQNSVRALVKFIETEPHGDARTAACFRGYNMGDVGLDWNELGMVDTGRMCCGGRREEGYSHAKLQSLQGVSLKKPGNAEICGGTASSVEVRLSKSNQTTVNSHEDLRGPPRLLASR